MGRLIDFELSTFMVPEVGVPSIDELVLGEVERGQAYRYTVKALQNFE